MKKTLILIIPLALLTGTGCGTVILDRSRPEVPGTLLSFRFGAGSGGDRSCAQSAAGGR